MRAEQMTPEELKKGIRMAQANLADLPDTVLMQRASCRMLQGMLKRLISFYERRLIEGQYIIKRSLGETKNTQSLSSGPSVLTFNSKINNHG